MNKSDLKIEKTTFTIFELQQMIFNKLSGRQEIDLDKTTINNLSRDIKTIAISSAMFDIPQDVLYFVRDNGILYPLSRSAKILSIFMSYINNEFELLKNPIFDYPFCGHTYEQLEYAQQRIFLNIEFNAVIINKIDDIDVDNFITAFSILRDSL